MANPSGGATNDAPFDLIRKHLNPAITGPNTTALITGLAAGDADVIQIAETAFDQLFLDTASGIWLDRRAADNGVTRPPEIGFPDPLFRLLAIDTTASKVAVEAILEVLEIYYGSDNVRAFAFSSIAEPFLLGNGQQLSLLVDERDTLTVTFNSIDFQSITSAKAIEVATILNRNFATIGSNAYALVVKDISTQLNKVKIYSGALGLTGSIRVTGGQAQNALQFPTLLNIGTLVGAGWAVTIPTFQVARYTTTNTTNFVLSNVLIGDYVNIFGSEFNSVNQGSFPITNISITYSGGNYIQSFDVVNPSGAAQAGITQANANDVLFFRPTKNTILRNPTTVNVIAAQASPLTIQIPVTTQIVGRKVGNASYLQPTNTVSTVIPIISASRTTNVTTLLFFSQHGFIVGDTIYVNSTNSNFSSGLKLITNITTNTVSYAETNSNVSTTNNIGNVSSVIRDQNGNLTVITGTPHGLITGQNVIVDGFFPGVTTPIINAGTNTTTQTSQSTIWSTLTNTTVSKVRFAMTSAGTNIALVAGGANDTNNTVSATCTRYQTGAPFNNSDGSLGYNYSWTATASMNTGVESAAAVVLADPIYTGQTIVIGGSTTAVNSAITSSNLAQRYNPVGNAWTNTSGNLATARCRHAAILLNDNTVLVIGGNNNTTILGSCELYNFATDTFSATGTLNQARQRCQATLLSNGKVLVTGGDNASGPMATCEIYDPIAKTWSLTSNMSYARTNHVAVGLPNGYVLVTGGEGFEKTQSSSTLPLSNNEIFEPISYYNQSNTLVTDGRWKPAGQMLSARTRHNAVYDTITGNVVIISGENLLANTPTASVEYFNPNTFTYRSSPYGMNVGRAYARSLALQNGTILTVGGENENTNNVLNVQAIAFQNNWVTMVDVGNSTTWYLYVVVTNGTPSLTMSNTRPILNNPFVTYAYSSGSLPTLSNAAPAVPITTPNPTTVYNYLLFADITNSNNYYWYFNNNTFTVSTTQVSNNNFANTSTPELFIPASDYWALGGVDGYNLKITSTPNANKFIVNTGDYIGYSYDTAVSSQYTVVTAVPKTTIPDTYLWDPKNGSSITAVSTTTTSTIDQGQQLPILTVASTTGFPDQVGYLAFGYGYQYQIFPVKYLGNLNSTQLLIDDTFIFPKTIPSGATVTLLTSNAPFIPTNPAQVGSFYATASNMGHIDLIGTLNAILAGGIRSVVNIVYPADRGLGAEGFPTTNSQKLSDVVDVNGSDSLDLELPLIRLGQNA